METSLITFTLTHMVDVTADDIAEATERVADGMRPDEHCPLALALRRQLPAATSVHVGFPTIEVETPSFTLRANTTKALATFIRQFDDKRPTRPHRFRVRFAALLKLGL